MYGMREESGRIGVRMRVLQLAEQDIADYGALARSDQELEERARYHVAQMQAKLPVPQAVLADDMDALMQSVVASYTTAYNGLLVAYTGLKEPFRLELVPRYTTSAAFDESEHEFVGLAGLLSIIKAEQVIRRKNAREDGRNAEEYLLTMVQVTVYDSHEEGQETPRRLICYEVVGDDITGAYAQTGVSDELLRGLGLPLEMIQGRLSVE